MYSANKLEDLPKIYKITAIATLVTSILFLAFSIYNQFFYVDQDWKHDMFSNCFVSVTNIVWMGTLFFFNQMLSKVLHYNKVNVITYLYLAFTTFTTVFLITIVVKAFNIYFSDNLADALQNMTTAATTTSFSSFVLLYISNIALSILAVVLGSQVMKVTTVHKNLFLILGIVISIYGVCSLLIDFKVIENDTIILAVKTVVLGLIGFVMLKVSSMSPYDLPAPKINTHTPQAAPIKTRPQTESKIPSYTPPQKPVNTNTEKKKVVRKKKETINNTPLEIPTVNLNELENKEQVLNYFEGLSKLELDRLKNIVSKKYTQQLTEDQISDLVLQYIATNKPYDHNRFAPK